MDLLLILLLVALLYVSSRLMICGLMVMVFLLGVVEKIKEWMYGAKEK